MRSSSNVKRCPAVFVADNVVVGKALLSDHKTITLFDSVMAPFVSTSQWTADPDKYATGTKGRMHRCIMSRAGYELRGLEVDHINGERSDNRLCNLRLATKSQNRKNRRANANTATGVKGVTVEGKKFRASIYCDKKELHLGMYDTLEEAAKIRRAKELELFGEFARNQDKFGG